MSNRHGELLSCNIFWLIRFFETYTRYCVGFVRCENDSLPSIKWVLELAKFAVLRHGVRGLVIDPYNELDHQRPVSQ